MTESFQKIQERDAQLICRTYGRYPIAIERGSGSRLYDYDGKEYIDLLTGIAVTSLGHCNEEIAEVISAQARKLIHISNLLYHREQQDLAESLLALAHFNKVFFCNSGAEANEAMIKLARRYMQNIRKNNACEIITLESCFHGRTLGTLAATGRPALSDGFAPMPAGFKSVPWGNLEALENAIGPKTAGVLVEIVQGEGGVRPMNREYAEGIEAICRRNKVLFLVDEVQTGLCRTGKPWAFQHFDLHPDIISSAKALANGLPMGCIMAIDEVAQAFDGGSHGSTFGGGVLVSAAACKVLEIMRRDHLDARAAELGERLMQRLQAIAEKHPDKIREVRGMGLLIGVELSIPGKAVWEELLRRGFILNLSHEVILRLLPALTIDEDDLTAFANALDDILSA
ncbi:MAG: aspartate aminotransferase family protein [Desulfovibrionaceae bacterium]|nr:aspartate aminotransferase family protein [Desulfovibrionaceae bacterium]